jgi:hypothetical protein
LQPSAPVVPASKMARYAPNVPPAYVSGSTYATGPMTYAPTEMPYVYNNQTSYGYGYGVPTEQEPEDPAAAKYKTLLCVHFQTSGKCENGARYGADSFP